jgi:hypothetical protein
MAYYLGAKVGFALTFCPIRSQIDPILPSGPTGTRAPLRTPRALRRR